MNDNDSPIDHSECVKTSVGLSRAHTHEGEKGMWLFPSEVRKEDRETGNRLAKLRASAPSAVSLPPTVPRDVDGYDRNGAFDGWQVTSDADSGL